MAIIGNPPHSTHPWSTLLALATLSTTYSWRKISDSYSECIHSPDPSSVFYVMCCSVPVCFLFHCSMKFCNTKWYGNSYKIMPLEVETSCVHHFKDVQPWRDVAPYKQNFCLDFLLFSYSRMDQYLLQHTPTAEHFYPALLMIKASFSPNPSSALHVSPITTRPSSIWLHPSIFLLMLFLRVYIITNGLSNMCLIMVQAASDNRVITSIW